MDQSRSGVSAAISLPKGGGAIKGIGEKFQPDLFTGTGNFTVPIPLPAGRNGLQPELNLVYSTGNGNGPFGLGWNLSIPGVSRKTSSGVPLYNEAAEPLGKGERRDVFILSGAEDLVPVNGSYGDGDGKVQYRPRTEGLFARITHHRTRLDYWEVESKNGLRSFYGKYSEVDEPNDSLSESAVLAKPGAPGRIFAWRLTETRDSFGNVIRYEYERDSTIEGGHHWDQLLLKRICYADYSDDRGKDFLVEVKFVYEKKERPDPFSDRRAGFEIRTTKRCTEIEVSTHTADGISHPVRRYAFTYEQDPNNGVSLLTRLDVIGYDDAGHPYEDDSSDGAYPKQLPPLTFGYTRFEPDSRRFAAVKGKDLPADVLATASSELVDLHGGGLPDIVEMSGVARYWRNLGDGRFALRREMREVPSHRLGQPGVQLIDANGDGRMDLLVSSGGSAGYYPLTHHAAWDRRSFRPYAQTPSFRLDDAEVRLLDLDGDGITDALRSGSRLECFFNHPDQSLAWRRTCAKNRKSAKLFPDVNLSDPHVFTADMSGDGLQDIVVIHDRKIEYWPNLGHGEWGQRIVMRHPPHFGDAGYERGYDPHRILVGDVDGDGLADIVYVGRRRVLLWLNQSGNGWSKEPIDVCGTPDGTEAARLRLVDLYGSGVSGVLWIAAATSRSRRRLQFLDFTGGKKPYLLDEMDNHMGAVTRVKYETSTVHYLRDGRRPNTRWRTPLPFPVQVVARVEAIDEVSRGKLTTEYRYHHGYWDGAADEHEFRGFGLVEQLDSETIETYSGSELHGSREFTRFLKTVLEPQYSPPTLTKTWFHQGPVGEEFGDWHEVDYTREYWPNDPQLLDHTSRVNHFLRSRARRIKRDALRALRGSILRTELYALDESHRQGRPYTVLEYAYDLKEFDRPPDDSDQAARRRVFFPHQVAQRTTQWERGEDPLTQFSFTDYSDERTGDFDAFGRAHRQTAVAMPRLACRRRPLIGAVVGEIHPDESRILATQTHTQYAEPCSEERYVHDRVARTQVLELLDPPTFSESAGADLQQSLRDQYARAAGVHCTFVDARAGTLRLVADTINHYDGPAFEGLPVGQLGAEGHGAMVRTEVLVLNEPILQQAYRDANDSRRPHWLDGGLAQPDVPAGISQRSGYRKYQEGEDHHLAGWYANTERRQYDFQHGENCPRGLIKVTRDARGNDTHIDYDRHHLVPLTVRDSRGLETTAVYNERLMQPACVTDPNGTSTHVRYSPIGLPKAQFVRGTDAQGDETLGGTEEAPEIAFEYDFLNFHRDKKPIFVQTTRRVHHASDNRSDETIRTREYSDGFGRVVQTRSQAEDCVFGDAGDDVGLPGQAGEPPRPFLAHRASDSVVVSGWQTYDNKGRLIKKHEPFFSRGFAFEAEAERGQFAKLFYDPRGNVIRTESPDGSQQRVVLGRPNEPGELKLYLNDLESLDVPESFEPSPWETYTYDTNDLASVTHPASNRVHDSHHFTPASQVVDALGRVICQVQRNGRDPSKDWFVTRTQYDVRGNTLGVTDALGRQAFEYACDLLNRRLRVQSIDAGLRTSALDAMGNLIELQDSKGSLVRRVYDDLNRPKELWARDDEAGRITLRERLEYGDDGDHALARSHNTLGRTVRHFDEAGLLEMPEYDFKGNLLEKSRRTIRDEALANSWRADWNAPDAQHALEESAHRTSSRYDALNRPSELDYPEDVQGRRGKLSLSYNRAGALEAVDLDNATFVRHIAYNAKGQRLLIAYGNGLVTRHAYDAKTFRLARLRTDRAPTFAGELANFVGGHDRDSTFEVESSAVQDFAYTYDLAGNITRIDERTPHCGVRNGPHGSERLLREFDYDPLYRLLSATGRACRNIGVPRGVADASRCGFYAGGAATASQSNAPDLTESYTEHFEYDPAGNMLALHYDAESGQWARRFGMAGFTPAQWRAKLVPAAATVPTDWGQEGNRLTNFGSDENQARNHHFDANGNLIRQNSERHHTWDHADRMIGYRVQANDTSTPSIEARYLYGADGMRVKKWVRTQGGEVATSTYIDGVFERHRLRTNGEDKANDTLHVMDNQSRIALVRVGAPMDARDASPQVQYHLGDHLGSSHLVVGGDRVDASAFINREEYFPYGETSFGSFGRKRYRYSGKERDEETGLSYYGSRYYAMWLARWIGFDRKAEPLASTQYTYAHDSPLRFIDPSGNTPLDWAYKNLEHREQYFEQAAENEFNHGSRFRMWAYLAEAAIATVGKHAVPTNEDAFVTMATSPIGGTAVYVGRRASRLTKLLDWMIAGARKASNRIPRSSSHYMQQAISASEREFTAQLQGKYFEGMCADVFDVVDLNRLARNRRLERGGQFPVVDLYDVKEDKFVSVATGEEGQLVKKFFELYGFVKGSKYQRMLDHLKTLGLLNGGEEEFQQRAVLWVADKKIAEALIAAIRRDPQGQLLLKQYGEEITQKVRVAPLDLSQHASQAP